MVKVVLFTLIEALESEKNLRLNITIDGTSKKIRMKLLSIFKKAHWHTDPETSNFPSGWLVHSKNGVYKNVDVTMYKPKIKEREEVIKSEN